MLSTSPTLKLQPFTMHTRSGALPRRDVSDPGASQLPNADRAGPPAEAQDAVDDGGVAGASQLPDADCAGPPAEVQDAVDDGGEVAFVYSRGPYTGIQVSRADVRSLDVGQEARDGVIDALARYIWQEELSSSDARGCLVLCSVFCKLLRERGPAGVLAMTQGVNVFDYFTWVFFFCEGNHWRCAVLYNVPRLERALRMAADGCAAHTGQPVATLAFFNSLGGRRASTYSRVRDDIFTWVHAVALEKLAVETNAPPARWISSCVSVVSPLVPQQGATVDCGMYVLSFFSSFFKCSVEDRCALLCSGAAGRSAWRSAFVLKSRDELRAVCDALEARHSAAAARRRPPRQLKLKMKLTLDAPPPSAAIVAASTAASPHDATCSPALGEIPRDGSASFGKTGRVAVSAPSTQVAVVQTAPSIPQPSNPSSGAALSSLLALAPPGLPVGKRAAASAQEPPSAADGQAAGRRFLTRSQGPGAAPLNRQAPTCATETKRRRLSRADAATAAWLSAFKKWRLDYEPDVAHDLVVIFSACDALLPSFITHYASGVAKWYPPVDRDGLKPWFVDVLNTGPGHGQARSEREGPSGGISRVMRSRVHGVFCAAYAFHGTPMPGA